MAKLIHFTTSFAFLVALITSSSYAIQVAEAIREIKPIMMKEYNYFSSSNNIEKQRSGVGGGVHMGRFGGCCHPQLEVGN